MEKNFSNVKREVLPRASGSRKSKKGKEYLGNEFHGRLELQKGRSLVSGEIAKGGVDSIIRRRRTIPACQTSYWG